MPKMLLQEELDSYETAYKTKERIAALIDEIVAGNEMMMKVMQITGIRSKNAFALVAYIEDIERFATAKKLVAYIGLNPVMCESGKSKSPRRVSKFGVRTLKSSLIQGAKKGIYAGMTAQHEWARRKIMEGKAKNLMCCALARKMVVCVWHIMKGDYAPNRKTEKSYESKLISFASDLGKTYMRENGFATRQAFADKLLEAVFGHLPPLTEEQNAAVENGKVKRERQTGMIKKESKRQKQEAR